MHDLGVMINGTRFVERQLAQSSILLFSRRILKYKFSNLFQDPYSKEELDSRMLCVDFTHPYSVELWSLKEPEERFVSPQEFSPSKTEVEEINLFLQKSSDSFANTGKLKRFPIMRYGSVEYVSRLSKYEIPSHFFTLLSRSQFSF